jgi:hypothetical protein
VDLASWMPLLASLVQIVNALSFMLFGSFTITATQSGKELERCFFSQQRTAGSGFSRKDSQLKVILWLHFESDVNGWFSVGFHVTRDLHKELSPSTNN